MRRINASGLAGLARNAENPARRADSSHRISAKADNAMAGIRRLIFEFGRMRRMNESPSSFGMRQIGNQDVGYAVV